MTLRNSKDYLANPGIATHGVFFAALVGLWAIWKQVLPALEVIGDVALWTYKTEVDGVTKIVPKFSLTSE